MVVNLDASIRAIAASFMLSGCYNSGEPREKVLKIYNWADYIGDGVLEDFQAYYKEQTGEDIRIVYQTFDINEIMLTKIEKGHEDFDVVCPSEYIIERMLVAVISNGTAVLGLGDIGALSGKPVMEGKGLLFKIYAGIDVFDIEVNEKDPDMFPQCPSPERAATALPPYHA